MPTYDYRCNACGHSFEKVQRISEDPIKECPNCGKLEASRQITQGNFILKGSGWYGDLYSGASNKKGGSSESSSSSSSTAAASSSTSTSTTTTSTTSSDSSASSAPAAPATSTPSSGGTGGSGT